ncbi:MAG: Sua5/YciO/YrdC/YwlC family protein [Candidatus Vogelbacteria bacterium]|nr:Sua5/YciO/YrdC/YwlC family protein [Candidatus Vogelbacteria bacterium]
MPIRFPAVIPTDTIYGLVGRALNRREVAAVYRLKKRPARKPSIVLISRLDDLRLFGVKLNPKRKVVLKRLWPGRVSIIIDGQAFRLPAKKTLLKLLKQTGPLVAPSANPAAEPPAQTITKAKKYFGNAVATYVNGGRLRGKPSKLIKLNRRGQITVLRP